MCVINGWKMSICTLRLLYSKATLLSMQAKESFQSNEIIITGTTGIIAASYYYTTPLECMILFWLFFFPAWQMANCLNYPFTLWNLFNLNQLPSWRPSSRKYVQPAKHDYKLFLSNHVAVYHSKQYLSYCYSNINSCLY